MYVFPPFHQHQLLIFNNVFGPVEDGPLHPIRRFDLWQAISAKEPDLGIAIAQNMDMRWFMIIFEYHKTQPSLSMGNYHIQ
jgi:hypothetical protein